MKTISLCMIVKNEEDYFLNCLKSISDIVDEIVIVLTGENNNTEKIAKMFTNKIYKFKWINDFSAARNYAFSFATKDYIMWLDSDDILKEEDRIKFKKLKEKMDGTIDYYNMIYDYGFNSDGTPSLTFKRNRIVKNNGTFKWIGYIHEYIECRGKLETTNIHITHTRKHGNGTRNLDIFEYNKSLGKKFSSRDIFYYARELFYNNKFELAIENFNKFIEIKQIWIEDKLAAYIKMSECYKNLGNAIKERESLMKTLEIFPRAEAIYRLANSYMNEKNYKSAIYLFESIFNLTFPKESQGFLNIDMWNFLPHLQLCVCYYNINNIEKSYYHHLECKKLKPSYSSVIINDEFFNKIIKENKN